jgi:molybdopterin synthase sulfur carrier subunit
VQVRLRFFAGLREQIGASAARTVPAGTTAGALWDALVAERPAIRAVQVRIAVNERYGDRAQLLAEGDEVAFFPPVSGGAGR